MKTLALILLVLICFLLHSSAGTYAAANMNGDLCCMKLTKNTFRRKKVTNVVMSSFRCIKAIVVTTVCGEQHCFDPKIEWAVKLLEDFKTAGNKSPFNTSKCVKHKRR